MFEGLFGMLAFLATVLGLGIGTVGLGLALRSHHYKQAQMIGKISLVWIGMYAAALLITSAASQIHYINPGQERCFDEMCYSVQEAAISPTLGSGPDQLRAQGIFYVVTLQLRSDSKRTAQKPSQPGLYAIDAQGQRYPRILNAGSELGLPIGQPVTPAQLWDLKIQPGETVRRTVAFDMPIPSLQPALVVSEGIGPLSLILIGDENSFFHAPTELLLKR